MQISKEYIEKIKGANSVEELKKVCADEKINVSDDKLKQCYDLYHSGSAELSDDELDNVSGGACYSSGVDGPNGFHQYLITTAGNSCLGHTSDSKPFLYTCGTCKYSFGIGLTMYCSAMSLDPMGE